jgi:hypothetical protein
MLTIDLTEALSGLFYLGLGLIVVTSAGIIFDGLQNWYDERAARKSEPASSARRLQHA